MSGRSAFSIAEGFILRHDEVIRHHIDLGTLVPKLYNKGVLTNDEREVVLYIPTPLPDRKRTLVQYLSKKGATAPRLLIECLREARDHLPHSDLADILENDLQTLNNTGHDGASAAAVHPSQRPPPSSSNTSQAGARHPMLNVVSPSHNPPAVHHSRSNPHVMASNTHGRINSQYYNAEPIAPTSRQCINPSASSRHGTSVANSLEELRQSSPEYAHLLLGISAELSLRGFHFEDIRRELMTISVNDAIPIELPHDVRDFPTLCLHLRQQKMCHETDVDLLCHLLHCLEQEDLKELVQEYADRVSSTNVMQFRHQPQDSPTPRHFLAFTFHNIPALSLEDVYEIKHHISEVLHLPRHSFSLTGAEPGSVVLAWQIPVEYLKHLRSSLEEDGEVRSFFMSGKYHLESIKLQVEAGSEREVVFVKSHDHASTAYMEVEGSHDQTSTKVVGSHDQASIKVEGSHDQPSMEVEGSRDQPSMEVEGSHNQPSTEPERRSVRRPITSHQEDTISSTTADEPPSLASEYSCKSHIHNVNALLRGMINVRRPRLTQKIITVRRRAISKEISQRTSW